MKIDTLFNNYIVIHKINLKKFIGVFEGKEKRFGSKTLTSAGNINLFKKEEMNYLNMELSKIFTKLLDLYQIKNFVFEVTSIWKNFYKKLDYQENHVHPAHFSFIIYSNVDKSHTVFNNPARNIIEASDTSNIFNVQFQPKCETGDMIVFPSYLEHWVKPNKNNETIAGNIKFKKITFNETK